MKEPGFLVGVSHWNFDLVDLGQPSHSVWLQWRHYWPVIRQADETDGRLFSHVFSLCQREDFIPPDLPVDVERQFCTTRLHTATQTVFMNLMKEKC